jgi:hypothetical protein
MTKEEILEGNRLIIESPFCPESIKINIEHFKESGNEIGLNEYLERLNIDKDWNLLMEVVEKIEALGFQVFIHNEGCYMRKWHWKGNFPYFGSVGQTKIEATYKVITDFIKWHNSQSK